jgi:hypothetical protein
LNRRSILPLLLAVTTLATHAPAALAECGQDLTTADLVAMLEGAEWSYGQADLPGFSAATEQIRIQLPCLSEELPRNIAARVHRVVGLRGFVDRDPEVSTRAFAAARAIEPAYTFPSAMVPTGNPVLLDYNAVPVEAGQHDDVLAPAEGYLVFDGRPDHSRPRSWPTVVQFVASSGEVTDTYYLWPDQSLPVYEIASSQPVTDPLPVEPPPSATDRKFNAPVLAIAGGMAAASGALFVVSRSVHGSYYDPATPMADLDALRVRHNSLVWSSRGTAAGAVLLGAGAFMVVRW